MLTVTDNDKQIIIALAHFDTLLSEPKMKKTLLNSTNFFSKKVNFFVKIVFHLFIFFLKIKNTSRVCCFVYFEYMY